MYDSNILLIDDEQALLEMVYQLLRDEGYKNIECGSSCNEARQFISKNTYQLIILDVNLPDGNGFDLYFDLLKQGQFDTPVIFLSARDEDADKLRGLGLGADDYITKPFLPMELLLRIKAVLRRTNKEVGKVDTISFGETKFSLDAGTVTRQNKVTALTAKEYSILKKLSENRGKIVSIDDLCESLWPDGSYGLESSLIVHIRHLREKIEDDPSKPKYIITVRGLGYRLEK